MEFRALISSQSAAAHTLSGKLYPTLIGAVQRQLGFDSASTKLQNCMNGKKVGSVDQLIHETILWCSTLSFQINQDFGEVESDSSALDESERELKQAYQTVETAISRGLAKPESVFIFHVVRYHTDYILAMRYLAAEWDNLRKLCTLVREYQDLCDSRQKSFDRDLTNFFYNKGRTEEGLALAQLASMELHQGQTNILGIAMFFAIVSRAQKFSTRTSRPTSDQKVQLNKYYTDALHQEVVIPPEGKSDVRMFLEQYGDAHMDGLERRLTDFINAATEVRLQGINFVGPTRHTASNVLMACREIVENNAVRIKLDGALHHRVDMQLILFQEAARRLESMEANGGTAEAVARGSIFTASAKLIRNLHRIVSQWKRNYISKQQQSAQNKGQPGPQDMLESAAPDDMLPLFSGLLDSNDNLFMDEFLDWNNWPRLDVADFSGVFPFDFDASEL